MSSLASVCSWLKEITKSSNFSAREIPFSKSREWVFKNGSIAHKSSRFFEVIGLEWETTGNRIASQPFIDQQEIGTLGFLITKNSSDIEVLVQAKIEPGNVKTIQLAPTCQSTASNAARVHGGDEPPFIKAFTPGNKDIVYDKLQSEQGTIFFGKRNRNVLRVVNKSSIPHSPFHSWINTKDMFYFLQKNFLVNTDARSVLVSAPWNILVNRAPFSKSKTGFSKDLLISYNIVNEALLEKAKKCILYEKGMSRSATKIDISKINEWILCENGLISSSNKPFDIRQILVNTNCREVVCWDQPLVKSKGPGKIILLCGREKGVLRFLFKASREIGLYNKVELTPSIVIEPGSNKRNPILSKKGFVRAECFQSEEGGRFYHCINHYQIIDIGEVRKTKDEQYWLTVGEIRQLLNEEGWFTNEARSALSLLLQWV
ncbi:MAG: NDP-hexose 2,3-dehydratase family protein [Planctomycetes bacterium]|nr:NDP-hexose 2,3-dehydratase family protein [Planctomycetota bacterium]